MTTYWNCWTNNYDYREQGYMMHAVTDNGNKTLCGRVIQEIGIRRIPEDDPHPGCLRCRDIMAKRGVIDPVKPA